MVNGQRSELLVGRQFTSRTPAADLEPPRKPGNRRDDHDLNSGPLREMGGTLVDEDSVSRIDRIRKQGSKCEDSQSQAQFNSGKILAQTKGARVIVFLTVSGS